jgi:tetratricopeptide (TPR) repeat protein
MINNKKLRPNTIIPDSLYVQRSADRQLQSIIEDMGRPGYVLVARQMGKTNLLLNAKRKYSTEKDIFAYLDVSNSFPELRDFFRNIIDVIVDSLPESLQHTGEALFTKRAQSGLLPHKEHESELRTILRLVNGKIVICLDEIDALTKTAYSDQIFSLIRSIYFSGRANFPEFNNLTYILSGVAEPTDIIKNKEISPFNIGEKIYLEDFSRAEFLDFLAKGDLNFSQIIADRIYYWANGNPRITWDISSAVEDIMLQRGDIDISEIDALVKKMYLTNFDLPPIDHIRTLVEDDKDIRSAIMSIHYGKSDGIADPLRNKLYLAGICSVDVQSRNVVIKNKIIENALSETWIRQVDRAKFSIEEIAKSHFAQGNYREALEAYSEFALKTTDEVSKVWPYYYMGLCAYSLDDTESAIKYLTMFPLKKSSHGSAYFHSKKISALSHYRAGRHSIAANLFEEAMKGIDKVELPYEYQEIASNFASSLYKGDLSKFQQSILIYEEVLSSSKAFLDDVDPDSRWRALVAHTHSNIAGVYRAQGDVINAKLQYKKALELSDLFAKPALMMRLAEFSELKQEKVSFAKDAAAFILENKIPVSPTAEDFRILDVQVCISILIQLDVETDAALRSSLIHHFASHLPANADSADIIVDEFIVSLLKLNLGSLAKDFLDLFLALDSPSLGHRVRRRLISLQIVLDVSNIPKYEDEYLRLVEEGGFIESDYDYGALFVLVTSNVEANNFIRASEIIAMSKNSTPGVEWSKGGTLVINYLQTLTQLKSDATAETMKAAGAFLRLTTNAKNLYLPFFSPGFQNSMRKSIYSAMRLAAVAPEQKIRTTPKYGRNDLVTVIFKDGREVTAKYKTLEADLDKGHCSVKLSD